MPHSTVIPELAYPDVAEAIDWLCNAFGFTLRLRIGSHRAQLNAGDGAIVVTERKTPPVNGCGHAVMVRVDNVDAHHERTCQSGAPVFGPPTTYPYGERQYCVQDFAGHTWTFSQSVSDVDPQDWGGQPGQL